MTMKGNSMEKYQVKPVTVMTSATDWTLRELQPQQLQTVNGGQAVNGEISRNELRAFFEELLQM